MIGPPNTVDDSGDEPRETCIHDVRKEEYCWKCVHDIPPTFVGGNLIRMQVRQGDKFVLMFEQKLPAEAVERIKEMWKEFIGDKDAKLLVLTDGAKLGVFNDGDAK